MRSDRSKPERGFTLVEVLVALFVMALMAAMAWRGIDALLRSRDIAQSRLDQSARLQTVMAQWEQDLRSLQDVGVVEALGFDGASLRFTRKRDLGMQMISWSVRDGRLYRWEGPTVQTVAALNESYTRSQQFLAQDAQRLLTLEGISGWQLYCYRGNSWSNCLSSGNVVGAAAPPASGASGVTVQPQSPQLPTGVRMVLQFHESSGFKGPLTRQIVLGPQT